MQVSEIINRERRKRRGKRVKKVNEEIEVEWRNFFMELLEKVEKRIRRGIRKGRERVEEGE